MEYATRKPERSTTVRPAGTVAMGQEARHQARAYDWAVQKERYRSIVDRLIAERRS